MTMVEGNLNALTKLSMHEAPLLQPFWASTHLSVLVVWHRNDCVGGDTFHSIDAAVERSNNSEMKLETVSL